MQVPLKSILVSTSRYEQAVGLHPRKAGYRRWVFRIGELKVEFNGLYSFAEKHARKFARDNGAWAIELVV